MHEEMIASIPQKQQDTVLQVVLVHDDTGASHIELRYMTWATGLGWYRQKMLALDRDAARALLRELGQVRSRMGATHQRENGSNVIPLADSGRRQKTSATPFRGSQRA